MVRKYGVSLALRPRCKGLVVPALVMLAGMTPLACRSAGESLHLRALQVLHNSVTLSWKDNRNEDGFHIERCRGSGCADFAVIGSTGANINTFVSSGLVASTTYRFRVRAFSSSGLSAYTNTITVTTADEPWGPAPLTITTTSLPPGQVGQAYSAQLQASGGDPPYSWSVVSGQLPPGLVLSASGAVTGTPSLAATFSFTLKVRDEAGRSDSDALSLQVAATPQAEFQIATQSLPGATLGQEYSFFFSASGGTPPYDPWLVLVGTLPPGLILGAEHGWLNGIPRQAGSYGFTVRVSDATGAVAQRGFTLTVGLAPPPPSSPLPPAGDVALIVDRTKTFQTWRAWRGTVYGSKKEPAPSCVEPPQTVLNEAHDSLVNELGFNGFRYEQHPSQQLETTNDNTDPFVINQAAFDLGLNNPIFPRQCGNVPLTDIIPKVVTPLRNKVLARGDPFELYVSFIYGVFSDMPSHWRANTQEAVEAFQATLNWWNTNAGYRPNFMTFNEPDVDYFGGSAWMGNFCAQFKSRMDAAGLATKLEMPSVVNPSEATWRWDTMIALPGCSPGISRLTYHAYDFNTTLWPSASAITDRNNLRTRAHSIGIQTGMGEICCRSIVGPAGSYDEGMDHVRNALLEMTEADAQSWEPLSLDCCRCSDNNCVVGSSATGTVINYKNDGSDFFLNPNFWVLRQLTSKIRPGHVRVAATLTGATTTADRGPNIKAVAFTSPKGTVLVTILNDDSVARSVTLMGIPDGTYDLHKLDSTICTTSGLQRNRCTPQVAQIAVSGGATLLTVPANAVFTVVQR